MPVTIDGGAGVTFPDGVQQTNGVTNTGGEPRYYAARAWGVFDGTVNPCTILAGANVVSVARNGTGLYTVTFTSPMPNANYTIVANARDTASPDTFLMCVTLYTAPSTTTFGLRVTRVSIGGTASALDVNSARVSFTVFV